MKNADTIDLFNFNLETGKEKPYIPLCYKTFGRPLGTARVVLVHYVLTGNDGTTETYKTINTDHFTVVVFTLQALSCFTPRDIARIFWEGLLYLGIKEVFTIVGSNFGKEIASEMTALHPTKIKGLPPVANAGTNKRLLNHTAVVLLKKDSLETPRETDYIPSAIPDAIKNSIEYVQD